MTFKVNWERADSLQRLPKHIIHQMVILAYPDKQIKTYQVISAGCANINVKFWLEGDYHPLILRIYLHDKAAAYREQKIYKLIYKTIPVPQIHYIGIVDEFCFAVTEFMPGISLRDLLLKDHTYELSAIMQSAGETLAKITEYVFSEVGFFNKDLQVSNLINQTNYVDFAKYCLKDRVVLEQLTENTCRKINYYLEKYRSLFPDSTDSHLVHADFDPANILVNKVENTWKITAILDWEFSFSGSVLWDIANMLRYAHQMPEKYQSSFLNGLISYGINLSDNWQITVYMLNIVSLLDCLKRSDPHLRPNQCRDIKELINHILMQLSTTK